MGLNFKTFSKFKDFFKNSHSNGLQVSQFAYELSMELWEKEYKNQSFLTEASNFIETFMSQLDEKNKECLIPFKNEFIFYLFEEGAKEVKEIKNRIALTPQLKEVCQDNLLLGFQKQVNFYNQYLLEQDNNYQKFKGTCLFYVFLLIAAVEDFCLTRHMQAISTLSLEDKGYHYLCCPSKAHLEIQPEQSVRIFIESGDPEEGGVFYGRVAQDLEKLEPKTNKVYFFTLKENLPSNLLSEDSDFNLKFVTTKSIKEKCYSNNDKVKTVEEILYLCKETKNYWQNYKFSKNEIKEITKLLRQKLKRYSSFDLLKGGYQKYIDNLDVVDTKEEENISLEDTSLNENDLEGATAEQGKIEKFKEFLQNGQSNCNYSEVTSPNSLFLKIGEEKYQGRSFLEIGSCFIDELTEKFKNTGKKELLDPFQGAYSSYLLKELQVSEHFTENIITFFNLQKNEQIAFLKSMRSSNQFSSQAFGLGATLKDYKDAYDKFLLQLNEKHDEGQRDVLHFAILRISALEEFLMTEEFGGSRQVKFLFSPSPIHATINSKETILLVVKDERYVEKRAIYQLNRQKDLTNKYIFTLNKGLSFDFFSLCADEGIKIVTTKDIKEKGYANNNKVIDFESGLVLCKSKVRFGHNYNFSAREREEIKLLLRQKLNEVLESSILTDGYQKQINLLESYEGGSSGLRSKFMKQ